MLPEGYVYPKGERAVRDLMRRRSRLVQKHTANLLAVQTTLLAMRALKGSIELLEEHVRKQVKLRPAYRHLLSVSVLAPCWG